MTPARAASPVSALHPAQTDEAGFTLIEVLIALLILVSGMVSVLALFTHAVTVHRQAVDEARASIAFDAILDRMRVAWNETGSTGSVQALTFEDLSISPFRVTTKAEPLADAPDALAVTVRLEWARGRKDQESELSTVLLRDDFAGRVRREASPHPK